MDVYTLEQSSLGRDQVIDEYESLIWTERHIDPGEVRLILPATEKNYALMTPGQLLAHINSQELMLVDTRAVKAGMITASGPSLEKFLDERNNGAFEATDTPAGIMGAIVQNMIDRYEYAILPNGDATTIFIPGLMVGYLEPGDGTMVTEQVEAGPCYTNVMKIARKYGYNFGLFRVWDDLNGWELHFSVHMGKDRTSEQSVNKLVKFTPGMDSLGDPEDVTSDAGFKSVALAMPPTGMQIQIDPKVSITPDPIKISRVPNGDDFQQPWRERVLEVNCDDIELSDLGPEGTTGDAQLARLYELMEARARKALRKQQRTDMVSGEITPESQYKYKGDNSDPNVTTFDLGDKVEFGGHFGLIRQGTVTEYVRSSDNSGSRAYPGLSERPVPVLQAQLGEQVISWSTSLDGFWSDSDLAVAKPTFFRADRDMTLLAGDGDVSRIGTSALKVRYRWGDDAEHSHYLEFDVPEPPAGASDLRAYVWGYTDVNGIDNWVGFRLDTNAGGSFLWVWDGDSGFWYEEPEGDQDYYLTYGVIRPDTWAGWHATTRIIPTGVAIV